MNAHTGVFYLVATPIGNLLDFTPRAIDCLKNVHLVCAEDTRHSQKLLKHYSINTPMISVHEHNEHQRIERIVNVLKRGESVALISDAGTPLVSDPGFQMVRALCEMNFTICPIPGASAVTAALVASGLPTDRYCFLGFSPSKSSARKSWFQTFDHRFGTCIFFESKHRILASLEDLASVLGNEVKICVAREITKEYESFYRGSLASVIEQLASMPNQLGEYVVLVNIEPPQTLESHDLNGQSITLTVQQLYKLLQTNPNQKQLAGFLAEQQGGSKQTWYKSIQTLKVQDDYLDDHQDEQNED